jgi:hypothetical protein
MAQKVYRPYRVPLQKSDGTWLLSDLYASAFLHALGHCVLGVETEIYDAAARPTFIFADSGVFESDYQRFAVGAEIGIRKFLDSFYHLKRILKGTPGLYHVRKKWYAK